MMLRPYQIEWRDRLWQSMQDGKRPVGVLPTGGGKTVVFADIASRVFKAGGDVVFLAHRENILMQIAIEVTRQTDILPQVISGNAGTVRQRVRSFNRYATPSRAMKCAMVQTVAKRDGFFNLLPKKSLIIVDECHHSASPQWARIINGLRKDIMVMGVTATPFRLDGYGLSEFYDDMVVGASVSELIALGFLAQPVYYAPSFTLKRADIKKTAKGEFDATDGGEKMAKLAGDHVADYLRFAKDKAMIAFCYNIDHAKAVLMEFQKAGVSAEILHSKLDAKDQFAAIDKLKSQKIKILISVDMVNEGFDVPHVDGIICLRQTSSVGRWRQMLGRALRPYPSKKHAIILDHAGNTTELGGAEDNINYSLIGEKQGVAPEIVATRTCKSCFSVFSAKRAKCNMCGTPYMVEKQGAPEQDFDNRLERVR